MGYAWNDHCYQDTATALNAFALNIPSSDSNGINSFTAAPTISASGLISWSLSNRPLNSTTAAQLRTGTTQLLTCTENLAQYDIQALFFVASLFFAGFLGLKTGYRT